MDVEMNPMAASVDDKTTHIQSVLQQKILTTTRCSTLLGGMKQKYGEKIVHYETKGEGMSSFWALFTVSHTIMSKRGTWIHMAFYVCIAALSSFLINITEASKSVQPLNVPGEIQTVLSFIIAGYVTICVGRWDRIRNTYLTAITGNLECLYCYVSLVTRNRPTNDVCNSINRYSQLLLRSVFLAAQRDDALSELFNEGLLVEREMEWLQHTPTGSRPYLIIGWIIDTIEMDLNFDSDKIFWNKLLSHIDNIKSGIGGIFALTNTQLPYSYVHLIYMTTYLLLVALAAETGVMLAVNAERQMNGNGEYDDDHYRWPQHPKEWMGHSAISIITTKVIFAFFLEGLLRVTDIIQNPLSMKATAFSENLLQINLSNNSNAVRAGFVSHREFASE